MKKIILLSAALTCLAGVPAANAQLIIQPTIVESAQPAYVAAPAQVVVSYPVHIEHHHRYDWRYWDERHDHDHDRDHWDHR